MTVESPCETCMGTGEVPSRIGPAACPDCGGAGKLPPKSVLTDWRARDIERAVSSGIVVHPSDVKFLISELHAARSALTEVVALAHDIEDTDGIAQKIRLTANRALGLYDRQPV